MDAKRADYRGKSKRDLRYAESQLRNLNTKIDKLLNKLDEKEQDEAKTPEEECVICVNSKATMQTWPCGHRVVCRKCLVRTIQIAVSRRSLPLRCVVCRARVLRLKRSSDTRNATATVNGGRGPATAGTVVADAAAPTVARSHSLPTKLRRRMTSAVAVRSRSVGTGKADVRRQSSRVGRGHVGGRPKDFAGAAGWVEDAFATDDEDKEDADEDGEEDDEDSDEDEHGTTVKYRKLNSTVDRKHGGDNSQTKNGLQRILSKFKFWRYLRIKNNKH